MSHNDRKTSGQDQSGTAGQSGTHGHSPKSRRDEKDPNYEKRTWKEKDEMPELASWDTQAAGVVTHGNNHDREGEQDEDNEDMANEMENEGGAHNHVKDHKSPSGPRR